MHGVPTLEHHTTVQQNGIPKLFTPKAFEIAYTDYQKLMVDELNECTAGTAPAGQRNRTRCRD